MEAPAAAILFMALFEAAVAFRLLTFEGAELRYLAALFGLNAAVSLLTAASQAGIGGTDALLKLFDVPTAGLLFAFLLQLRGRPREALLAAGLGAVHGVAFFAVPGLGLGASDLLLRAVPLYGAYAAALLVLAGERSTRGAWLALAFLPRAVFFATLVLTGVAAAPESHLQTFGLAPVVVNAAAAFGLLLACCVATAWVFRRTSSVLRGPAVGAFVLGVLLAGALQTGPLSSAAVDVVNHTSLSLARGLFVLLAVGSMREVVLTLRDSIGAAVVAVAGATGASGLLQFAGVLPSFAFGAGLGVLTLSLLITFDAPAVPPPVSALRAARSPGPALPQWQLLVLQLRGSSDEAVPPSPAWTQKALVAATGVPVQRVSEFPQRLNARAASRLDHWVPDWRSRFPPAGGPKLVRRFDGGVPGLAGVQVYYRLTPAGEALAEAVAEGVQAEAGAPDPAGGSAGIRSPVHPTRGP